MANGEIDMGQLDTLLGAPFLSSWDTMSGSLEQNRDFCTSRRKSKMKQPLPEDSSDASALTFIGVDGWIFNKSLHHEDAPGGESCVDTVIWDQHLAHKCTHFHLNC